MTSSYVRVPRYHTLDSWGSHLLSTSDIIWRGTALVTDHERLCVMI